MEQVSTKKTVIIVAGGVGKRMQSATPKQFLLLNNLPILMHTINRFNSFDTSINIIVVLPENEIGTWKTLCIKHEFKVNHQVIIGGKERFYSVKNGLKAITEKGIVAIHDGVRPFVSVATIDKSFNEATKNKTAIPVIPIMETLRKTTADGSKTVNRDLYQLVQTPQCFDYETIHKGYEQSFDKKFTDDASVVENLGIKINLVEGNKENIKITTPSDLALGTFYLSNP